METLSSFLQLTETKTRKKRKQKMDFKIHERDSPGKNFTSLHTKFHLLNAQEKFKIQTNKIQKFLTSHSVVFF
ncbi:hypothetical protein LEP1GSC016_3163 [Leptospira borgpetersenii serovar Hardjo-bovis str. Sponselee]|uniref:Uncharacterized protein n=1 Tax=Leptospira borgpetersenii serovar Hardjo-bovis str. Sponselee TaxID=1303729 RepID=M6BYP2_LEPBO|nr:hypothetical protein LEP1GSC016_3163 [Leptospira borgpetersenii serovar Hardjo-bovis str. Sponselee]